MIDLSQAWAAAKEPHSGSPLHAQTSAQAGVLDAETVDLGGFGNSLEAAVAALAQKLVDVKVSGLAALASKLVDVEVGGLSTSASKLVDVNVSGLAASASKFVDVEVGGLAASASKLVDIEVGDAGMNMKIDVKAISWYTKLDVKETSRCVEPFVVCCPFVRVVFVQISPAVLPI